MGDTTPLYILVTCGLAVSGWMILEVHRLGNVITQLVEQGLGYKDDIIAIYEELGKIRERLHKVESSVATREGQIMEHLNEIEKKMGIK